MEVFQKMFGKDNNKNRKIEDFGHVLNYDTFSKRI
jgi:hypothetical protein